MGVDAVTAPLRVAGLRLDQAQWVITRSLLTGDLSADRDDECRRFAFLTPDEQAVLVLLAEGLTRVEIARRINQLDLLSRRFTEETVKTISRELRVRCRARNSTHLVAMAVRAGVTDWPNLSPPACWCGRSGTV